MKKENSIEPSDPRLTAYVVGEMAAGESAAFEKELKGSPEAKAEVERIRETADLLKTEFAAELDAAFQPAASVAAMAPTESADSAKVVRFPEMRTAVVGVAAAFIAMAVVAVTLWLRKEKNLTVAGADPIAVSGVSDKAPSPAFESAAGMAMTAPEGSGITADGVEYFFTDSDGLEGDTVMAPAQNSGGFHLAGLNEDSSNLRFDARYLGNDSITPEGRNLSDDPIDPQRLPLPASSNSRGQVPLNPAGYTIEGLDSELGENLAYTDRVVTYAQRISGDAEGEKSRSLFRAEKTSDEAGNKQVRVTGRVQVQELESDPIERKLTEAYREGAKMDLAQQNFGMPADFQTAKEHSLPASATPVDSSDAATAPNSRPTPMPASGPAAATPAPAESFDDSFAAAPRPDGGDMRRGFLSNFGRPAREKGGRDDDSGAAPAAAPATSSTPALVPEPAAAPRMKEVPASASIVSGAQPITVPVPNPPTPASSFSGMAGTGLSSIADQNQPHDGLKVEFEPLKEEQRENAGSLNTGVTSSGAVELQKINAAGKIVWVDRVSEVRGDAHPALDESESRSRDSSLGRHAPTTDNPFKDPMQTALSTFSVDVDTASYTETRRLILKDGRLPSRDQVRIEEFLNYFEYHSYPAPKMKDVEAGEAAPFSVNLESAAAPWNPVNRIVRIGLKGAEIPAGKRPAANLVFLLDVSGSMKPADKLPLMQKCLREMLPQLREDDRVTMVVYASKAGEVLPPTPGNDKKTIQEAIDALSAKGSTNGEGGIRIAYQRARENFIEGGVNRILLATDGDFNVGQDSDADLVSLIEKEAKSDIFLTVLGFGTGNLNDSMLEKITNKGNGQFHYIDRLEEGRRVLVEQMDGALVTIAKDVKLQVEFNPGKVAAWRLIGYANRLMPREDFRDDTKDAGEIGAGHTVTALYEVVPVEALMQLTQAEEVEGMKYKRKVDGEDEEFVSPFELRRRQMKKNGVDLVDSPELLTVKLRYKQPDADVSEPELEFPLVDPKAEFAEASRDLRFATAVATFGMRLRQHEVLAPWHDGQVIRQFESIGKIAQQAIEGDEFGRKKEFVEMIKAAAKLSGGTIDLGNENDDLPADRDGGVEKSVKDKLNQLR